MRPGFLVAFRASSTVKAGKEVADAKNVEIIVL